MDWWRGFSGWTTVWGCGNGLLGLAQHQRYRLWVYLGDCVGIKLGFWDFMASV